MRQPEKAAPWLFVLIATIACLFLAWNMPPFMNADELAHAQRADVTTFGHLIGERVGTPQERVAGGMVDVPLAEAAGVFNDLQFDPTEKVRQADFDEAARYRFDGRIAQTGFPGAAVYPPVFYGPASLGLGFGKALGWRILDSLYLARVLTALSCVAVGFLALQTAGRARLPLFALLTLPMSVSLYSSVSTDGLLLTTTALGVALISRAIFEDRALLPKEALLAALCFGLAAATKPPYAALALIFLVAPGLSAKWRGLSAGLAIALCAGWNMWMAAAVRTPTRLPGTAVDPTAQVAHLLAHPETILPIATRTLSEEWDFYVRSFVGVLGWLDTPLPDGVYPFALGGLALAFLAALTAWRSTRWSLAKALAAPLALVAAGGVFLGMYLVWSDVGLDQVNGVQGRYFLPLAVFLTLLVEAPASVSGPSRRKRMALRDGAAWLVLLAPVAFLAITQRAVILRYYLA
jgi:uncharacterized membrane protein